MTKTLVFLDCETGGLNPQTDPLVEISWCVGVDGTIKTLIPPHDTMTVDSEAAAINGYYTRGLADHTKWASQTALEDFASELIGATLVGANPGFDAAFLCKQFGWTMNGAPWHYRMLDIESAAYFVTGKQLRGMKALADSLRDIGHPIPEPNHTAAGDVEALCAIYKALAQES